MSDRETPTPVEAIEQRIEDALARIAALPDGAAVTLPRGAFEALFGALHRQQTINLIALNLTLAVALDRKDMLHDLSDKLRAELLRAEDLLALFAEAAAAHNGAHA